MAGVITSTNTNNNALLIFLQRRLLATLLPKAHFYQLSEKYKIPQGSGLQMTFTAWRRIVPASSTLNQSASNEPVALSSRKINVTISPYGRNASISELAESATISSPTQGAIEMLMSSMALTIDNVIQMAVFKNAIGMAGKDGADGKTKILSAYMSAVASAFCANTGTTGTVASNLQFGFPAVFATSAARLSAVDKAAPSISARFGPIGVRKAVARLDSFDVERYADGSLYGVVHPKTVQTCLGNSDYKAWLVNYAEGPRETMFKGVLGPSIHGVKFLVSSNAPRYAVAAHSVHLTAILGREALGCIELDNPEVIIKRTGPQSVSDPYSLVAATVAFKAKMVAVALNPSAGCILFSHEAV